MVRKIFVTSDLHFGHYGILKHAKRPFKTLTEMHNTIIDNWNSVVSKNDIVYVLGDIAYRGNADELIKKLNGEIRLIIGNHDKGLSKNIIPYQRNYEEINVDNTLYILFHYPLCTWNGIYKNSVHLHGHVHTSGKPWETPNLPNIHNVCCEFHEYVPVEITKFKSVNFINSLTQKGM